MDLAIARKSTPWPTVLVGTTLAASAVEPLIVKMGMLGSASAVQLLVLKSIFGLIFMVPLYRKIGTLNYVLMRIG